jgi:hypothetical protein
MLYTMERKVSKEFGLHVRDAAGKMRHSFSPGFCHAKAYRCPDPSRCNAA